MIATILFGVCIVSTIGFQIALLLGAPWGRLTQGGQVDGPLPLGGRIFAALSIVILAAIALTILSADGRWPHWPRWTAWAALAMLSLTTLLNWITPSTAERRLWGPITTFMLFLAAAVVWPPLS